MQNLIGKLVGRSASAFGTDLPSYFQRSVLPLSREFSFRLKELVSFKPDWDHSGATQISPEVAQKVEDLAVAALRAGIEEPLVAPASDGSLGVDWHLGSGTIVGLFVGTDEELEPVAIITGDTVSEVSVSSASELVKLLVRYSRA